jgi:hypothetical protein
MGLNVLCCFPELWDATAGKIKNSDYRDSKMYQSMLKRCMDSRSTRYAVTYPHCQFFGINSQKSPTMPRPGTLPFRNFLDTDMHEGKSKRIRSLPRPGDTDYNGTSS